MCGEKLAKYKIPKRFFVERTLHMLPIGKVDKVALQKKESQSNDK